MCPEIENTSAPAHQPSPAPGAAPVNGPFGKLDSSGEIEPQVFDPTPFIGKNSFIESVEEHEGKFGFFIKVLSLPVDEGQNPIRASKIFGLQADAEGKIGWGEKSQLGIFLKKFNAQHYRDLVSDPKIEAMNDKDGKKFRRISGGQKTAIIIQTQTAKDGKDYLSF